MEDQGLAIDQEVLTRQRVPGRFRRHEANRIAVSEGEGTGAENVAGVVALGDVDRAAVVDDDAFAHEGLDSDTAVRALLGGDQILLRKTCLGRRVDHNPGELLLGVAQPLHSVNEGRSREVGRCTCSVRNIVHVAGHGGRAEHSAKFRKQDRLYPARPISGNEITNGPHRVVTGKVARQIVRSPSTPTPENNCFILSRLDPSGRQRVLVVQQLISPTKVIPKRHISRASTRRCQPVKLLVIFDNAALDQCGQFHCPLNHVRVKHFGDNNVSNTSCHFSSPHDFFN